MQKIIDQLTSEKNEQANLIFDLQRKNSKLNKNHKVSIPAMEMGAGSSHDATGQSSTSQCPTVQNTTQTTPDTTIIDNVTKPIVRG